jgi:hypothetical protein
MNKESVLIETIHSECFITDFITLLDDHFFNYIWEIKPCYYKLKNTRDSESIFSRDNFLDILKDSTIKASSRNMKAVKYLNNSKSLLKLSNTNTSLLSSCKQAFDDGFTIQFFQPQRFSDQLHKIIAQFELIFGSLAGSSAYLTPGNSQGLAPHYDDVDVFIFHLEGTKLWHIWPNPLVCMPETSSGDLDYSSFKDKPSVLRLHPGDILYMPRGTVHEAIAEDSFTTHVTISLYQKYHYKSLLEHVLPQLLDKISDQNSEFRFGLPIRMQDFLGTFSSKCYIPFLRKIDQNLTQNSSQIQPKEINHIKYHLSLCQSRRQVVKEKLSHLLKQMQNFLLTNEGDDVIDVAMDEILQDFIHHRLPPVDNCLNSDIDAGKSTSSINKNKLNKRIKLLNKDDYIKVCDRREFECAIVGVEGVSTLSLWHCRHNSRLRHMGHPLASFNSHIMGDENEHTCPSSFFPCRLSPIIAYLWNKSNTNQFPLSIGEVISQMTPFRIFPDEVRF